MMMRMMKGRHPTNDIARFIIQLCHACAVASAVPFPRDIEIIDLGEERKERVGGGVGVFLAISA